MVTVICKSAETGLTLFLFVALVLLFALPLLRFKFHALVALYSQLRAALALDWMSSAITIKDSVRPIFTDNLHSWLVVTVQIRHLLAILFAVQLY